MSGAAGRGGTGACVRCEEAGTRPSARVGLAMSVFTHGVDRNDKPLLVIHNKVFPVGNGNKTLSTRQMPGTSEGTCAGGHRELVMASRHCLPIVSGLPAGNS